MSDRQCQLQSLTPLQRGKPHGAKCAGGMRRRGPLPPALPKASLVAQVTYSSTGPLRRLLLLLPTTLFILQVRKRRLSHLLRLTQVGGGSQTGSQSLNPDGALQGAGPEAGATVPLFKTGHDPSRQ